MRVKYQTVEVAIGNAVAADTITSGELRNPDKEFPWITGVWVKAQTLPGGNTYVNAGVADGTQGEVLELAPSELYYGDSSVDATRKFVPIRIKNDGRTIKPKVKNPVLTTSAGLVVFVFRLEQLEEARPNQ